MPRRALVVSIVHTPLDARIHYRQIRALLDGGWAVTQVAPWRAHGITPPDGVEAVDVTRAAGRHRLAAIRHARRLITEHAARTDVVLLHDPELLLSVAGLSERPPTVWDVHEDTAGAVIDKLWLPGALRPVAAAGARAAERWAEANLHLILAEEGYRDRFRRDHPVVPNHPVVPDEVRPPDDDRIVYVGRLSPGRGVATILAAAAELAGEVTVELVGPADDEVRADLTRAVERGEVVWHGFLPNDVALAKVDGALAGLSLLRDEPNYRTSLPTKVVEYLARGVPPVTSPLPRARALVESAECGLVVPFDDAPAVVAAVRELRADRGRRHAMAERGRAVVLERHSWQADAPRFVALLEEWARADGSRAPEGARR